jgi:hypothetical protein
MHLVQLLLPVEREQGVRFDRSLFDRVEAELTERFGGFTAYSRSPATGVWEEHSGRTVRERIVVYEVMVERLTPAWWAKLRQRLESQFEQEEVVIRAQVIRRL